MFRRIITHADDDRQLMDDVGRRWSGPFRLRKEDIAELDRVPGLYVIYTLPYVVLYVGMSGDSVTERLRTYLAGRSHNRYLNAIFAAAPNRPIQLVTCLFAVLPCSDLSRAEIRRMEKQYIEAWVPECNVHGVARSGLPGTALGNA